MTDNELLLQISKIVTTNTKYLEYRIDQLDEKLSNRIDEVERKLNARIDEVEERLTNKIDEVDHRLSARIDELDQRLSHDIKRICVDIENDIKPRLQNIESCYLDTSRRHNANIEKIDKMEIDVDVIKSVLQDHIEFINQQIA